MQKKFDRFQLTSSITQKYQKNVLPYELVVETIHLQNKELRELQKKYIELKQNNGKNFQQEDEELLMKNRENQRIIERKKFMEEALIINEPKYKAQYERKQKELAEEIGYKEEEVQSAEEGSINIFMNLEEGVLNQLVEENRKNEEVCGCVRNWKDVYENLKKL